MDLVVPGQRLGPAASAASSSSSSTTSSSGLAAGAGCYVHNGSVVASLVGRRLEQNGVVSVVQLAHLASLSPHVGNTVTCRVREFRLGEASPRVLYKAVRWQRRSDRELEMSCPTT